MIGFPPGPGREFAPRPAASLGRLLLLLAVASLLPHPLADPLSAQARPNHRTENRMLREASALEAQGDLDRAESVLRELLVLSPQSSTALIALERILRADDRVADLLPALDAFLADGNANRRIRALHLNVLAELAAAAALAEAIAAWIATDPESLEPWVTGARSWRTLGDPLRGAALLEEALEERGEHPSLLIELGDLRREAGQTDQAAASWARALARDRASRAAIFRRVEALGAERTGAARQMVAALIAGSPSVSRLEIAAELALREELDDDLVMLFDKAREELNDVDARALLMAFARRAEELERAESALHAWTLLRTVIDDPAEARSADERLAEVALATGDSAAALIALARVTASHPIESTWRQRAWSAELHLRIALSASEETLAALNAFRAEFPEAPELNSLSSALAGRLLGQGQRAAAMELLDGIEGPVASLERAFLLLEAGALTEGAVALQAALPDLEAAMVTEVLALVLALNELTPAGGALVADVALALHRDRPAEGVRAVRIRADSVPATDRAAVLAIGARAADESGLTEDAMAFRRRIVTDHADAREFPEAALGLARAIARADADGDRSEAVHILEELIVQWPASPVAPSARVELERIRKGGS